MQRLMCLGKIHRARVTAACVDYVGSITVDTELLEAAGILPYEQVQVYDITNGTRLETYTYPGERGTGKVEVNGAAARLVKEGDLIIIAAYGWLDHREAENFKPKIVLVDEQNRVTSVIS